MILVTIAVSVALLAGSLYAILKHSEEQKARTPKAAGCRSSRKRVG